MHVRSLTWSGTLCALFVSIAPSATGFQYSTIHGTDCVQNDDGPNATDDAVLYNEDGFNGANANSETSTVFGFCPLHRLNTTEPMSSVWVRARVGSYGWCHVCSVSPLGQDGGSDCTAA